MRNYLKERLSFCGVDFMFLPSLKVKNVRTLKETTNKSLMDSLMLDGIEALEVIYSLTDISDQMSYNEWVAVTNNADFDEKVKCGDESITMPFNWLVVCYVSMQLKVDDKTVDILNDSDVQGKEDLLFILKKN